MINVSGNAPELPHEYKISKNESYELFKVIKIIKQIQPRTTRKLNDLENILTNCFITEKDKETHYLISSGTQIISFLFFLNKANLDKKIVNSEWFGRLIVDLLFLMKFNFHRIPTEYLDTINRLVNDLKEKYPIFYKTTLVKFLEYEYDDMFFLYQSKILSFEEYYNNVNKIDRNNLTTKGAFVHIVVPFLFSTNKKYVMRKKYFLENLERLSKQTYENIKIHVSLVNARGHKEFANELRDRFQLIKNIALSEVNIGGAKARNIVTRRIIEEENEKDYILYIDDDTYLNDIDVIAKLVHAFKTNRDAGCVAPQIIYGESTRSSILNNGYEPPWEFSTYKGFEKLDKKKMKVTQTMKETFLVEASCMLVPIKYLKKSDLYPEEYNYYHEETLLENKIRLEQNKRVYVMRNGYALHQRVGGGTVTEHAMYYYYRNFEFFLEDIGVKNKNKEAFELIMSQFYDYCYMLIEGKPNQEQLKSRIEKAKNDLEEYRRTGLRPLKNSEFDSTGDYKFI